MQTAPTLLALSPHLDDAVLAVGALLARAAMQGRTVVVATLYTQGPGADAVPRALRAFADFGRRRAEDAAAVAALGGRPEWLDLTERVFRVPPLRRPLDVFACPDAEGVTGEDRVPAAVPPAETAFTALLERYPRAEVLVPLALGYHHDHVVACIAACRALVRLGRLPEARFYEDIYAASALARARHFVTGRHDAPPRPWLERRSLLALGITAMLALAKAAPGPEPYLPPALRGATWRAEGLRLDPAECAVHWTAARCYRSQLGALGGERRWRTLLARWPRGQRDTLVLWTASCVPAATTCPNDPPVQSASRG